jgi:tape measure domain-containing protein
MAKDLQLDIEIQGDESKFAAAVGMSVKDLKKLQDAVSTVNRAIGKESAAAFNDLNKGTQAAAKGFDSVSKAADKTGKKVEETSESFKRFKEIVAGVFTGEALFHGVEAAVHTLEEGVRRTVDLFKEASVQAGDMELKVRGMGNLFRSQGFAQNLKDQLQTMAYASPFQLKDLMDAAQRLTGFGIKKEDLLETVKDLGNIVAGLGGSKAEMDRAALAYGEAITSQTLTTREINQLTQLGVPVWEALEKMTGKTNQELHKMIEKHMLSSSYMTKVIEDLTHGSGLFTDAMQHFSETFVGLVTTFQDKAGTAIRDLGDVINTFVAAFLKFINNAPLWNALHNWFVRFKDEAQAILSYLPTMFERMSFLPKMALIGEKFQEFFRKLFGGFDMAQMFKEVMIPSTGDIQAVLTPAGEQWISNLQKFIDPIIELVTTFVDFAKNQATISTLQWFADRFQFAVQEFIRNMQQLMTYFDKAVRFWQALLHGNLGEAGRIWIDMLKDTFRSEVTEPAKEYPYKSLPKPGILSPEQLALSAAEEKYRQLILSHATKEQIDAARAQRDEALRAVQAQKQHTEATNANKAAIDTTNKGLIELKVSIDATMNSLKFLTSAMGNFPITGMPGAGGFTDLTGPGGSLAVREEYDWEGRSSQYGPRGNRLLTGPYVGLNPQEMGKYGVHQGDYVHTQAGWLRIQESASRRGTIEFHADRPGQFEGRWNRLNIDAVRRAGQASVNNIYYSPTIQHVGDAAHFEGLLSDHATHIAQLVGDVHRQALERAASV